MAYVITTLFLLNNMIVEVMVPVPSQRPLEACVGDVSEGDVHTHMVHTHLTCRALDGVLEDFVITGVHEV